MAKATVITVETPDADADTVTFADSEIETIQLSTYPFSKYNTEGIDGAVEHVVDWLDMAREHERGDVREWMRDFAKEVINTHSRYKFVIDWDQLVLVAYRDLYNGVDHRNDPDAVAWRSSQQVADAAMAALTWSYKAPRLSVDIDQYAVLALRAAVLAAAPDAASIFLDYTGDEDGSLYVTGLTLRNGDQMILDDTLDPDGEIARAASDIRNPKRVLHLVGVSDYELDIRPIEPLPEDNS